MCVKRFRRFKSTEIRRVFFFLTNTLAHIVKYNIRCAYCVRMTRRSPVLDPFDLNVFFFNNNNWRERVAAAARRRNIVGNRKKKQKKFQQYFFRIANVMCYIEIFNAEHTHTHTHTSKRVL